MLVHNAKSIVAAAQAPGSRDSEHGGFKVELLLALHTGLTKLQSVRWNPSDENVIGAVSSASRLINIYDLQRTQGRATRTLTLPAQSSGGVGAGDIAFFGKSAGPAGARGYSVVVGGPSGQVFLWDLRCSGAPVSTLTSLQGGAVNAVHVLENGQAVLAGTQSGDIKVWDVRGGCGGALRFGGVLHHHPMLACVNLRAALGQVAGLAEQAGGVPSCRIHSMAIDPGAPARVGFHLGCGWSGVLDLASRHITHVHAPPQHLVDEQPSAEDGARALVLWAQTAAPGLRRRACWLADGRRFAVPSRQQDAVMLLDFADSAHAGCRVPSPVEDELAAEASGEAWDEAGEVRLPPAAATVPISQTAICTAAIPNSTMMVACGAHNFMSVLDYS